MKKTDSIKNTSIKRKFLIYSIVLFSVILVGGGTAFAFSLWQNMRSSIGLEIAGDVEIERIKLEASVNSEIAIAIKMAGSPLIQRYFQNPYDSELESLAFDEIAGYRRAFKGNTVFWVNDIDHMFYSDDAYIYTLDINDPNNYWYMMTLNETELYNFNINFNPDLNVTNLWINAPVFDSRRRPVGILGTGIDLTSFIDSIFRGYSGDAELYIFNTLGEITGSKDARLVANKVSLVQHLGELGEAILEQTKSLNSEDVQYFSAAGSEIALCAVPTLDWYIAAIHSFSLADVLSNSITVVFFAMIAIVALIFIIFYIMISWMLKPLNIMIKTLDLISTNWDLTHQIEVKTKDEIGILGDYFNMTFSKMKELIFQIKEKTSVLSSTGDELASSMEKTKNDIEGVNSTIQGMRGQVLTQADKVNATAGSMDHIIKGLANLDEHISAQAENVARSSSAIEEMLANIQSVTQTLVKNTANINLLAETSEAGRGDLQKVSTDIQEIAKESEGLLQINSVMQTIASQTNLLSMNAAIEAAHAGESGKGFAVVADEIRKLAENSGAQSKTISAVLKKIKTMIDTITKSTSIVMERFAEIEQEVSTVSAQESQIRNAMEEQGAGSRQILEAITQLNSTTGLVRQASSSVIAESNDVLNESKDLKQITTTVAENMDNISQCADNMTTVIVRVQDISKENKTNIDELQTDIKRFKVE